MIGNNVKKFRNNGKKVTVHVFLYSCKYVVRKKGDGACILVFL